VAAFWPVLKQGGPWAVLLLCVAAFVVALVKGWLMRGSDLERIERRMEKDTDRVLALYVKQIDALVAAAGKKDDTIAAQDAQIGKLLEASTVSAVALDRIVKEAERRGFFAT
jgi:hypothetical protein